MGKDSKIEWTDHTFNPWWGCMKVSPGCANCYAETLARRYAYNIWGPPAVTKRRTFGDRHWAEPLAWNRAAERNGKRARVFCASMADIAEDHPDLPPQRARLAELVESTPWLNWLFLSKRPENYASMFHWFSSGNQPPDNVWLGTSVENQEQADKRIPILLQLPAAIRFLSCEPLLGPIDLSALLTGWRTETKPTPAHIIGAPPATDYARLSFIRWVIVGGESGPRARPMHPDWVRQLRDQCFVSGVPFYFKQWGEFEYGLIRKDDHFVGGFHVKTKSGKIAITSALVLDGGPVAAVRVGKKRAGRRLGGREWNEFPELQP